MWNITVEGGSEVYVRHNGDFVARFKYARPKACAKHFVKFLVKNFTPEEYMEAKKNMAPVLVLQTKGYVSYNVLYARKKGWV